jgi:hypothetical protein
MSRVSLSLTPTLFTSVALVKCRRGHVHEEIPTSFVGNTVIYAVKTVDPVTGAMTFMHDLTLDVFGYGANLRIE